MKATEISLFSFFGTNSQYIVPSFQRPYYWNSERWDTFISGLFDSFAKHPEQDIFLGAIVIMPTADSSESLKKYLLVDGQKRLITILALLAAMRSAIAAISPELAEKIAHMCFLNKDKSGSYHYKLLPNKRNRTSFFNSLEGVDSSGQRNLFPASIFFYQRICSENNDLTAFTSYLLEKIKIVRISLDKNENPYPIFRSMNMSDKPQKLDDLIQFSNFADDPELMILIASGESDHIEFKEGISGTYKQGKYIENMGHNIVRNVAAFMNNGGGTILIGVTDDGKIKGLKDEYIKADQSKKNWDGFELHVHNMIRQSLEGSNATQYYKMKKHSIAGKDICAINIKPADKPVYHNKHLYVRNGNQTIELLGPDLVEYLNKQWDKNEN
jgi:hypothetical protein